ncbi:MAG: preprotein translocase subunit YajC [Clostridia bacterium]|nr:preprotein translocase subunit YajC [Clostridia bacterium]MBQ5905469.1 preprotein translocase subunit YajC [Clostridia bacterium]
MYLLEATAAGSTAGGSQYSMIIMMVGMFALMYFMMIRPQKKRQKEEQEMRNAVDIGDEITTIGGICGKVVSVKENNLVIETGADRTRMLITRWSVQQNNSAMERLAAEREAAKAAQEKAKAEKKAAKSKKED